MAKSKHRGINFFGIFGFPNRTKFSFVHSSWEVTKARRTGTTHTVLDYVVYRMFYALAVIGISVYSLTLATDIRFDTCGILIHVAYAFGFLRQVLAHNHHQKPLGRRQKLPEQLIITDEIERGGKTYYISKRISTLPMGDLSPYEKLIWILFNTSSTWALASLFAYIFRLHPLVLVSLDSKPPFMVKVALLMALVDVLCNTIPMKVGHIIYPIFFAIILIILLPLSTEAAYVISFKDFVAEVKLLGFIILSFAVIFGLALLRDFCISILDKSRSASTQQRLRAQKRLARRKNMQEIMDDHGKLIKIVIQHQALEAQDVVVWKANMDEKDAVDELDWAGNSSDEDDIIESSQYPSTVSTKAPPAYRYTSNAAQAFGEGVPNRSQEPVPKPPLEVSIKTNKYTIKPKPAIQTISISSLMSEVGESTPRLSVAGSPNRIIVPVADKKTEKLTDAYFKFVNIFRPNPAPKPLGADEADELAKIRLPTPPSSIPKLGTRILDLIKGLPNGDDDILHDSRKHRGTSPKTPPKSDQSRRQKHATMERGDRESNDLMEASKSAEMQTDNAATIGRPNTYNIPRTEGHTNGKQKQDLVDKTPPTTGSWKMRRIFPSLWDPEDTELMHERKEYEKHHMEHGRLPFVEHVNEDSPAVDSKIETRLYKSFERPYNLPDNVAGILKKRSGGTNKNKLKQLMDKRWHRIQKGQPGDPVYDPMVLPNVPNAEARFHYLDEKLYQINDGGRVPLELVPKFRTHPGFTVHQSTGKETTPSQLESQWEGPASVKNRKSARRDSVVVFHPLVQYFGLPETEVEIANYPKTNSDPATASNKTQTLLGILYKAAHKNKYGRKE